MEEKKVIKKKKKKKGARTAVILALVLASGVGGAFLWKQKKAAGAAKTNDQVQTAEAAVMDITSELTASSSLSPKDTYEVTSLVEGEVLEAQMCIRDRPITLLFLISAAPGITL